MSLGTTTAIPSRELTRTIGKSTLFGIAANLAQLVTRLVTVPIAVSHLGLDGYGIWSIIMTTAAYMRFGSVGIKSAFQKYAADATGNGDYARASRLISTGTFIILGISVVVLLPVSVFSRSLAVMIGVPGQFVESTAGAITLLALIMVLSNSGAAYESIVMGGHRIDWVRKFNIVTTILEAIAVIMLLRSGFGLFAMAAVMAVSEIAYVTFCFVMSRRLLPQIEIRLQNMSREVLGELAGFAGSYQLKGILEIAYAAILPIVVLRAFGATSAGVYAIASRLVLAALLPQESLLQPILSGGSMIYASGSIEQMRLLISKAFKTLLVMSVPLLAFVSLFGDTIVYAWTGEHGKAFRIALLLLSVAGLFKSLYSLGSVFYRVSGRSVLDNVAQALRIVLILIVGALASRLGFEEILGGLAVVEFIAMAFIVVTIEKTFERVTVGTMLSKIWQPMGAAALIVSVGFLVLRLNLSFGASGRALALIQLIVLSLSAVVVTVPALLITRCISGSEIGEITAIFKRKGYVSA